MGTLTYDSALSADFDDRTLAHLQIVVGAKLRRKEAFYFSWKDDTSIGDGRSVIWMHPTISLAFKFSSTHAPAINREWVDELMLLANSPAGLYLTAEPSVPSSSDSIDVA